MASSTAVAWTYCRDCLFWRMWDLDKNEAVLAPASFTKPHSDIGPWCYRRALSGSTGHESDECGPGCGCGDGAPRRKGKK